ncbi:helix-turn-helix transcriptional regulator [Gordonia malaquae]|uniref:helix-turn-helix domain-containing protein n=1 Tax=Gordonia malaquae TaxID=410332 RepID=UPI0030C79168
MLLTALLFADRAYGLPKKFGRVATMNDNEPDLERLARYVKSRRQHLGLRQDEVGARGGPSTTTLTKVENATPPAPATVTLRKLDRGLGWTAGSARRLLEGGEPETEGDDDSAAVDRAYYQLSHPPQRFQTKASTPEGARAAAVLWVEILESFDLAVRAVDMGATVGSARSFLQAAFGLTMSSGMAGAMDDPTLTEEAIRRFSSAMQKIEAIAAQSTDVENEDEGEHHDHQPDTADSPATQPRAQGKAPEDQKTFSDVGYRLSGMATAAENILEAFAALAENPVVGREMIDAHYALVQDAASMPEETAPFMDADVLTRLDRVRAEADRIMQSWTLVKPTDLSERRSRREAGRDFGKDPLIEKHEAAYEGDAGSTDYDHTSGPPADAPDPAGPENGA